MYLFVTAVILGLLPFVVVGYWKAKKKSEVSIYIYFIGAAGFIISARVCEMIPHIFCILLDNPISRFITGNTVAYVLYGISMAGIFEECGRYVILRFFIKKNRTKVNAITYGIGHGGIEVWLIALPVVIMYLATAMSTLTNGRNAAVAAYGETMFTATATFGFGSAVLMVLERVICMGLHTALSVVVFASVETGKKKYLLYAILLHAVFDIFPALYQRGVVPMYASEIWLATCLPITVAFAWELYAKTRVSEKVS